jgi:hypothetical protein
MENWVMDTMNKRLEKNPNNIVTNPYRELWEIEDGPDRIIIFKILLYLPLKFVGNVAGYNYYVSIEFIAVF